MNLKVFLYFIISSALISNSVSKYTNRHVGKPLFLTEYLEKNKIQDAQDAARVKISAMENISSYAGYITVNKLFNSNMFFWFFESKTDPINDPVILWLAGGPGCSSLFGVYLEHGPFQVNNELILTSRQHTWINNHSVIYIDNPVGTGYSFTSGGYARNQTQVGRDLYVFLRQFFQIFHQYRHNDFFVSGESYGGKYATSITRTIWLNNPKENVKINLKGMAIGNGMLDPMTQLSNYGEFLYQLGFIDENVKKQFLVLEDQFVEALRRNDYNEAGRVYAAMIDNSDSLLISNVGDRYIFNIFNYVTNLDYTARMVDYEIYIQRKSMRKALHVGNTTFGDATLTLYLEEDIYKSVKPWFIQLLTHFRILLFTGHLDIRIGYPLTRNFLVNLTESFATEYKETKREKYFVGGNLAGYLKKVGNLTDALLLKAGHFASYDQPQWINDMMLKFTRRLL